MEDEGKYSMVDGRFMEDESKYRTDGGLWRMKANIVCLMEDSSMKPYSTPWRINRTIWRMLSSSMNPPSTVLYLLSTSMNKSINMEDTIFAFILHEVEGRFMEDESKYSTVDGGFMEDESTYSTVDVGFMEDESRIVRLMEGSWRMKANIVWLMEGSWKLKANIVRLMDPP